MVDGIEEGSKVAFCLWCEDGLPCEAAKLAAEQPVRELPAARKPLTIKVPHPETTDLLRKAMDKAAPKMKAAVKKAIAKAAEEITECVHPVDGLEKQVKEKKQCRHPECKEMTASKIGCCSAHFYWGSKNPTGSAGSSGRSKRASADTPSDGLVPVMLSEAALNRVWNGSSLEEKARMISLYLGEIEPAQ
jgi:hypothetical protein